jgi:hypothetical protein
VILAGCSGSAAPDVDPSAGPPASSGGSPSGPENEPPPPPVLTSLDGQVATTKNVAANGRLRSNAPEGAAIGFLVGDAPAHGTLTIDDKAQGTFTYVPAADFVGRDTFTFVTTMGDRVSPPARVSIKVSSAAVNAISIVLESSGVTAGFCLGARVDREGDLDWMETPAVIGLAGPDLELRSQSGLACATSALAPTVTLAAGQASSATVYVRSTLSGDKTLTATDASAKVAPATTQLAIAPGRIAALSLTGPTQIALATCTKYNVKGRDSFGNPSTVMPAGALYFELHAPPVYQNSSCNTTHANGRYFGAPPIPAGLDFYLRPTSTGNFSFSVSAQGGSPNSNTIVYTVQ